MKRAHEAVVMEASGLFAMLSDFEVIEVLRMCREDPSPEQERDERTRFSALVAIGTTCRRLRLLATVPELWRDFDVVSVIATSGSHHRIAAARLRAAPWFSACETLDFSRLIFQPSNFAIELMAALPNLRELCFFVSALEPEEKGLLAEALGSLRRLRKLRTNIGLDLFWAHCRCIEDVDVTIGEDVFLDALGTSPCSQTLRRIRASFADCAQLSQAAPNLVSVDLRTAVNISGLASLDRLQELSIEASSSLDAFGERSCKAVLRKLTLYQGSSQFDSSLFLGAPCCSELEKITFSGFVSDPCFARIVSRRLRSFSSQFCPNNLDVLLSKHPALTKVKIEHVGTAGVLAKSLGQAPCAAPVRKFFVPILSSGDLQAIGKVLGQTLECVGSLTLNVDQTAIDAFKASCPRLRSIMDRVFGASHISGLLPRMVLAHIAKHGESEEAGVSFASLAQTLASRLTEAQLRVTLEHLLSEGFVFTTIDDNHFKTIEIYP